MPICKMCGCEKQLVEAHIVPKAFYRDMNADSANKMLWTLGTDEQKRVRRSPQGEYDPEIVCEDCEKLFQPYDQYAAELLIQDRDTAFERRSAGYGRTYFICDSADYRKLKLFLIAVLWRASVSQRSFFHRLSLGPYESTAADMIRSGDPGHPTQFDAILSRWTVAPGMALPPKFMANPFQGRPYDGVHTARIYLSSFVADVSVEKRPLPRSLSQGAMRPGQDLLVPGRDLHESGDLNAFAKVLSEAKPAFRR